MLGKDLLRNHVLHSDLVALRSHQIHCSHKADLNCCSQLPISWPFFWNAAGLTLEVLAVGKFISFFGNLFQQVINYLGKKIKFVVSSFGTFIFSHFVTWIKWPHNLQILLFYLKYSTLAGSWLTQHILAKYIGWISCFMSAEHVFQVSGHLCSCFTIPLQFSHGFCWQGYEHWSSRGPRQHHWSIPQEWHLLLNVLCLKGSPSGILGAGSTRASEREFLLILPKSTPFLQDPRAGHCWQWDEFQEGSICPLAVPRVFWGWLLSSGLLSLLRTAIQFHDDFAVQKPSFLKNFMWKGTNILLQRLTLRWN